MAFAEAKDQDQHQFNSAKWTNSATHGTNLHTGTKTHKDWTEPGQSNSQEAEEPNNNTNSHTIGQHTAVGDTQHWTKSKQKASTKENQRRQHYTHYTHTQSHLWFDTQNTLVA